MGRCLFEEVSGSGDGKVIDVTGAFLVRFLGSGSGCEGYGGVEGWSRETLG